MESLLEAQIMEIFDTKNHAQHFVKNMHIDKQLALAMALEQELQHLPK